jgi:hypothetical protein
VSLFRTAASAAVSDSLQILIGAILYIFYNFFDIGFLEGAEMMENVKIEVTKLGCEGVD